MENENHYVQIPSVIMISTRFLSALLLCSQLRCLYASLRGADDGNPVGGATKILHEDQDAMFLLKVTEYADYPALGLGVKTTEGGNRRPRKRTRNIQLSDGTIYQVKNSQAGWASGLMSGNNVHIPGGVVVSSNGTIDMNGQSPIPSDAVETQGEGLFQRGIRLRKLQGSVGIRTVLAVRVILDDGAYDAADPTGLSNDIFGNGVDPNNLKSQYAACSANQLQFEKSPNRIMASNPNDGGTTDIINGVVDIKVPLNKSSGDGVIRNTVTTKINSVFGVGSPVELADHVMYCLPAGSVSGIAYAYIDSWNSVFSNEWCNFVSAQMHEIGHNLGFAHSNELGTYNDQTDLMGYSYGIDDFPRMCFNGAKSWQSQWYTSKSVIVDPSADVGSCFDGNLYGIVDYSNPTSSVVLIKINDSSSADIYVAFNRKKGVNADTGEAGDEVTVVSASVEGSSYSSSELLAKLASGGVWSSIIDGKTMTVTVLRVNTSVSPAYATVRISENGSACLLENPPIGIPSPAPTSSPSTASTSTLPTASPTGIPTPRPSLSSTSSPSASPTGVPTSRPSPSPTSSPSISPTGVPTLRPSSITTFSPSSSAPSTTELPTLLPSSASPLSVSPISLPPTDSLTLTPSTASPAPSESPTTSAVTTNSPTISRKCCPRTPWWCFV